MNRVVAFVFHNWLLKLAAVILATMLYVGLVISQSAQELTGSIQVDAIGQPATVVLSDNLPRVTKVRYIALGDPNARASSDSFRATIDLAGVNPAAGSIYLPISVEAVDPRFRVLDFEPPGINVQLDPFKTRRVPVRVAQGPSPAGLDIRPPVLTPKEVSVSGPASIVDRVVAARADVIIEPSGLNVDRAIDLIPVDVLGNLLTPVDVEPSTVHVQIAVFSDSRSRSLAVNPVVTGTPAVGFEIGPITVDPPLVLVEGDNDELTALVRADTAPISISGATQAVSSEVPLDLPAGVLALGGDATVRVTIEIRQITATRLFDAGMALVGSRPDLEYRLSVSHALATVGGPLADLERLDAAAFILSVQVGGLGPGTHEVPLVANLPVGLSLVGVDPAVVTVTISLPPSASP